MGWKFNIRVRRMQKKLDQTDSVIFLSSGPAESVHCPVAMNGNKMCFLQLTVVISWYSNPAVV